MIRIFFFVVLAGLIALAGGVLMLGVFPPKPHPQAVEKVVPNDKFGPHAIVVLRSDLMDPKVDAFLEMLTIERGAARNTIESYTQRPQRFCRICRRTRP